MERVLIYRNTVAIFLISLLGPLQVNGHAYGINPLYRTDWTHYQNCGPDPNNPIKGLPISLDPVIPECGVCGDDIRNTVCPRPGDYNGIYGKGGATAVYRQNTTILMEVKVAYTHGGWMRWRLAQDARLVCDNPQLFNYTMSFLYQGNISTKIYIYTWTTGIPNTYQAPAQDIYLHGILPQYVYGDYVVIQYMYRAGLNNTINGVTTTNPKQETFFGCADIRIVPNGFLELLVSASVTGYCVAPTRDGNSAWALGLFSCDQTDKRQSILAYQPWDLYQTITNNIKVEVGGLCMTVGWASMTPGYQVSMENCWKGPQQSWKVIYVQYGTPSTTYMQLQVQHSKQCLSYISWISNKVTYYETVQQPCNSTDIKQMWGVSSFSK